MKVLFISLIGVLPVGFSSARAAANPRVFPFTYEPRTSAPGDLEVEQYVDLGPVRVAKETDGGTEAVTSLRSDLQTEFEYGVVPGCEVGWYFVYAQPASAGAPALEFRGIKQRVRLALTEPGVMPIDLGAYFEVAEYNRELEFEQKLLMGRHFGAFRVAANLWVEQEYYFHEAEWKFFYNPTVAGSYELVPSATVGLEYWARGRFDKPQPSLGQPPGDLSRPDTHHYLGPTLLLLGAEGFLTLGAYARLEGIEEEASVGDPSGKIWVRAILGIHL